MVQSGYARDSDTRSVGNCGEPPLPNAEITRVWSTPTSGAGFTDITACYADPIPFPTFLIHGEPSLNSGLGEATLEAPKRVPAGKPTSPSEGTLPMCGQTSSPRGAAVCPKQSLLLGCWGGRGQSKAWGA